MSQWPLQQSILNQNTNASSTRHLKRDKQEQLWSQPDVQPGNIGVASLFFDAANKASWRFGLDNLRDRALGRQSSFIMFAANDRNAASQHPRQESHFASQAAFLRTRYADIEVPAEILQSELNEDQAVLLERSNFDPMQGLMLSVMPTEGTSHHQLAFASGQDWNQLSLISLPSHNLPFIRRDNTPREFPISCKTYSSPILQVQFPTSGTQDGGTASPLAVRTMGGLYLHEIKHRPNRSFKQVGDICHFRREDFGGRHALDVKFHGQDSCTVVNDRGSFYDIRLSRGDKLIRSMDLSVPLAEESDNWVIAAHRDVNICLFASRRSVACFDLRAPHQTVTIYEPSHSFNVMTSVEHCPQENMVCAVTTGDMVWIDRRAPSKTLLNYRHGLAFDRTLRSSSTNVDQDHVTLLTSQHHGVVMAYSYRSQGFIQLSSTPQLLGSDYNEMSNFGTILAPAPTSPSLSILRLLSSGSLQTVHWPHTGSDWKPTSSANTGTARHVNADILASHHTPQGILDPKERAVYDFTSVLDGLRRTEDDISASPEALYTNLYEMQDFWQKADLPTDTMLNAHELSVLSTDEWPARTGVASFFASSPMTKPGARRIIEAGADAMSHVEEHAPQLFDLTESIRRISPQAVHDLPNAHAGQQLRAAGRVNRRRESSAATSASMRSQESEDMLVQDMFLATKIFSPRRINMRLGSNVAGVQADADIEDISAATNQLSISTPRPARHVYQYLQPVFVNSETSLSGLDRSSETVRDHGELMGARLLMAEWVLNADPEHYQYQNPYDNDGTHAPWQGSSNMSSTCTALSQPMPTQPTIVASKPRQPPILVVSKPQATMSASQPQPQPLERTAHPASQPTAFEPMIGLSQLLAIPSTQILPGPHGGRSNVTAKKPAKKRMGGF